MSIQEQVSALLSVDLADTHPQASDYRTYLSLGHTLVEQINKDQSRTQTIPAQTFRQLLSKIQALAFLRPDSGYDALLAEWTERQWACILQYDAQDIQSRVALGRSWLLKSQPSLARIEAIDNNIGEPTRGSPPQSNSRVPPTSTFRARGSHDDEQNRLDSTEYVQARDMLRAAIEHFDQALAVSRRTKILTGDCLEIAAEAYLHLANVTSPRTNEKSYQRALYLLRLAGGIDGYRMDSNLEQFLDENEDYIAQDIEPWY